MAELYALACRWETADDAERQPLRDLVKRLVGYDSKIACQENEGVVDIYVFHVKKKRVYDWIELQPSGAVGVIFSEYPEDEDIRAEHLDEKCMKYNDSISVEFEEESDSEEEVSAEEGAEEESSDEGNEDKTPAKE